MHNSFLLGYGLSGAERAAYSVSKRVLATSVSRSAGSVLLGADTSNSFVFLPAHRADAVMSYANIILEVQAKPEIWLSNHPCYKNKATTNKIWKEISTKLGLEGN